MFVEHCICPPIATNSYLVACHHERIAVIVDPGCESLELLGPLLDQHNLKLSAILLTHSHWDHICEAAAWHERYQIPVHVHPLDAPNLVAPGADLLPMPFAIRGCSVYEPLHDGQLIPVGTHHITVIHTPGHSPGSVCLYNKKTQQLFTGDTLFHGAIGNLSFPTSEPKKMWPSLEKLAFLPPSTEVYPGHGEATTIRAESSWLQQAEKIFG